VTALLVRPQADQDIDLAADFYVREANVNTALWFLVAVDQVFERLAMHPQIGTSAKNLEPRLALVRYWPVPGFETYLVFYLPLPGVVEILRMLHGARDLPRVFDEEPAG
jgi:plasmid stabilization system protein ParE